MKKLEGWHGFVFPFFKIEDMWNICGFSTQTSVKPWLAKENELSDIIHFVCSLESSDPAKPTKAKCNFSH